MALCLRCRPLNLWLRPDAFLSQKEDVCPEGSRRNKCRKLWNKLKLDSSHGLFYHYYSSLEEIFLELLNDADEKYLPPFAELSSLSGWIGLNALIAYYESALKVGKGPAVYYALLSLSVEDEAKLSPKIKKRIATKKLFTKFVKEGQGEGKVLGGDVKEIVATTIYLIESAYKMKLKKKDLLSSFDIVLGMLNKAPVR